MDGKGMLAALRSGAPVPQPPYIPILGKLAQVLGQVDEDAFVGDARVHAAALSETATALGADAITVGVGTSPAVGTDAVARLKPLLHGRALVGCLSEVDVAGARAYCEAGVDMIILRAVDRSNAGRLRTLAKACAFYQVLTILVDSAADRDGAGPGAVGAAEELGFRGAIVAHPTGDEPGIVGGGLSVASLGEVGLVPPRVAGFFWSFADEVPADCSPEELVALGARLHS